MEHKIINLISGPRNVSTALMYSFAQRNDTKVVDEPLYGHYLTITKEVYHPSQEKYLDNLESDGETAIKELILKNHGKPISFIKNMSHHIINLDTSFLDLVENVFLIRDPSQMIPSIVNQIPNPTTRDIALAQQKALFEQLESTNQKPIVIDSKQLLLDPKKILSVLCKKLSISFQDSMLNWKSGGITEDGPWAPYWYHNVHKSTGFAPYDEKNVKVEKHFEKLLEESLDYYRFLYQHAIKV